MLLVGVGGGSRGHDQAGVSFSEYGPILIIIVLAVGGAVALV